MEYQAQFKETMSRCIFKLPRLKVRVEGEGGEGDDDVPPVSDEGEHGARDVPRD